MLKNKYKVKKTLITLFMVVLMFTQNSFVVLAQTVPEQPSEPEAPSTPSAPSEPDSPEAPSLPSFMENDNDEESTSNNDSDREYSDTRHRDDDDDEEEEESDNNPSETSENTISSDQPEQTQSSGSQDNSGVVGDTTIETGDATNTADVITQANTNIEANSSVPEGSEGIQVINSDNGTDSENEGSVSVSDDSSTTQLNSALVVNNLSEETETGDNSASKNVGDSKIETGDANTTGTIITSVNTNIDGVMVSEFNVIDDHLGDIVLDFGSGCIVNCNQDTTLENSGNGSNSENTAVVDLSSNDLTFQSNDATVENNMVLSSDSGHNDTDNNTMGDSEILTGDANVSANALTFANNNFDGNIIYSVVNIFGDLIGDIIFPEGTCCFGSVFAGNTGNGTDSENNALLNLSDSDLTYQFNTADIQNNIVLDANTGENDTSNNTGGVSSVSTGDASAETQVINVANNNITGGDWWLVIVNEAGNWIGKILGAPVGSLLAGSDEFEFLLSDTGEITVTNAGNGQNSENTGVVNYETNNTTVQMNQANLINNLDLSANTGGNSASRNTAGDSNVTTGDAEIIANLVNFVNNNIVGGRLFVNVVNVFGSWIGDFVGPGFDKEEDSSLAQASSNDIGGANYTGGNSQSNTSQTSTKTINSTNDSTQDSVGDNNIISNISFSGFGLAGGSILGRNESDDETETSVGTYIPQISGKRVVNINLAYVLIFVLPFAVSLLRKRFGKVLLRN